MNTVGDGKPKPSDFFALYGITAGDLADYFNQDFLVSKITGQSSCAGKMAQIANTDTFSPNAGKYYCIAPDKWSIDIWRQYRKQMSEYMARIPKFSLFSYRRRFI